MEHEGDALWRKLSETVVPQGKCWVRRGVSTPMMWWGRKIWSAYRLAFALWNGPLPTGWSSVVHHRCQNRLCVKPSHLVLLSRQEHAAEHRRLRLETA